VLRRATLRKAKEADLELMLAWAQVPQYWQYLPSSRKGERLVWESHYSWWKSREDRVDWIIIYDDKQTRPRAVGVVHVANLDTVHPEVGLYIADEDIWGRSIGRGALELVLDKSKKVYDRLWAVIHPDNKRSIRLFTGLGFKEIGSAREGQCLYECTFGRPESTVPVRQVRGSPSYLPSPI